MGWSERQVALLREIGVHWASAGPTPPVPTPVTQAAAPVSEPEPAPATDMPVAAARPSDREPAGARQAVQALGWDELGAAVASCTACKLCQTRKQTVFGVGHRRSHWMVVGEAPGEQEDLRGEPFVGAAGRLLDSMLAALGLTRALPDGVIDEAADIDPRRQVYIANTLKCRPPGNRNPEPEELARCEPFLQRQIELVQPRIILAMGRFAVQSLLRSSEPVGKLRARVHRYHGVPLIVTYHPAYLLRNLPDKARAWEDLCLAAATREAMTDGA